SQLYFIPLLFALRRRLKSSILDTCHSGSLSGKIGNKSSVKHADEGGDQNYQADVNAVFLCAHNSARSQMAEGLLRAMYGDRYDVSGG
ncbi:MAG TPA: hypothetical protein VLB04_03540, partial [Methanotrichaceae archaeon]|nr:hypothetical protein [Methanotrichaceae archaeon]